jgi:hypothetical protein
MTEALPMRLPQLPEDIHKKLTELEGVLGLGMQKETLSIARDLLKRRPVHPVAFYEGLSAILIHADRLHCWRKAVEKAHGAIQPKFQPLVRSQMLGFYVSLKDWATAEQFLAKRPKSADDLMFTMWTFLELRKLKKAKPICRKCLKMLMVTKDRFTGSMLLDALGDYYAQIGDLDNAETASITSPPEEPLFDSAAARLVQIQAVRGRIYATLAQKKLGRGASDELDLMLPGNRKARSTAVHGKLEQYKSALHRIVPKDELWRFGASSKYKYGKFIE